MEFLSNYWVVFLIIAAVFLFAPVLVAALFRTVVEPNEVHIIQYTKKTVSYGKDTPNGNVYYSFPSWMPVIGVNGVVLPVNVFDVDLSKYEAYDKDRLPFMVDIKAFFRIGDHGVAASRVASVDELKNQLEALVQGAIRTVLAGSTIEQIMQGRATFGDQFTKEVAEQLSSWGVVTVKNIELMDIRDSQGSNVIKNIMDKKKSYIEMESRLEVAKNHRVAELSEIDAKRDIEKSKQDSEKEVGLRRVDNQKTVGIAEQEALQGIREKQKETAEKDMAVKKVNEIRTAEIAKERRTIDAEASKVATVLNAEAELEKKEREAKAIQLEGAARADAEKQMQMAPVQAQIELAEKVGANKEYQEYMVRIETVKAQAEVGVAQAGALQAANIKVIATGGSVSDGLSKIGDLFSANGGTKVGALLEGLAQTEVGGDILTKFLGKKAE